MAYYILHRCFVNVDKMKKGGMTPLLANYFFFLFLVFFFFVAFFFLAFVFFFEPRFGIITSFYNLL